MGKRKLRYFVRKNYERKRCLKLKISLPLSLYLTSTVSNVITLHLRTNALPDGWTLSSTPPVSSNGFTLSKLPFLVKVSSDCTWCFIIGMEEVNYRYSQILKSVLLKFTCVDDVVRLLTLLDNSLLCHGNPDTKFSAVREHYKGVFKDKSGEFL